MHQPQNQRRKRRRGGEGRRKTALRKEATHRNEATGIAQQRDNPQKVHPRANNSNSVAQSERQHANIPFGLSRQLRSEDLTCSPHITWEARLAWLSRRGANQPENISELPFFVWETGETCAAPYKP